MTYSYRTLVLMGAGANNLHIAQTLSRRKIPQLQVVCVANEEQVLNPTKLPGLVAGKKTLENSALVVGDILHKCCVEQIQDKVTAINATNNSVQLQSGHTLSFDWLSINTTSAQHREHIESLIPGAKKNGFFLYPMELFAQHWAQVCGDAQNKALRIAVIGGSVRSMEIALAVRQRQPLAAVTLITQLAQEQEPTPAAKRLLQALKKQRVTVLHDTALACSANHIHLGCGAQLACDVPIITQEPQAPAWLSNKNSPIFYWPLHCVQPANLLLNTIMDKVDSQTLTSRLAGWIRPNH